MKRATAKTIAALVVLALCQEWAPALTSLLVIVVLLQYATNAWATLAGIPAKQLGAMLVVAALALGAGYLAKIGAGALIVTGVVLLVTLPLLILALRGAQPAGDDPAGPNA